VRAVHETYRPAAFYKETCDPRVLFHAFKALHDLRAA
jgi:hypothetical protein